MNDENFSGLFEAPSRKILNVGDKMPFGKHKGEYVSDVPVSYLKWVHENVDWIELSEEVLEYALGGDIQDMDYYDDMRADLDAHWF